MAEVRSESSYSPSFSAFVDDCQAHNIGLDKVIAMGVTLRPEYDGTWPSQWLAGVAMAGELLRRKPSHALVGSLIPEAWLGAHALAEQRALVTILNDSLVRHPTAVALPVAPAYFELDCTAAEYRFGTAFAAMRTPPAQQTDMQRRSRWTILTHPADQAEPVAVTKHYGSKTTLALAEFSIAGVRYPAGSLVQVDHPGRYTPASQHQAVSITMATGAQFSRLTAYALPPERRADLFNNTSEAALWPMHDLRAIARTALHNHA